MRITKYYITRFFSRIQRILSILPVMWKDEDWDQEYLLELVRWKLRRIEKRLSSNHRFKSLDADKHAKKIRICINLITRIMKEDVGTIDPYIYLDYGELVKNPSIELEANTKEVKRHNRNCHMRELKVEQQNYDLLFKIMKQNIQRWWD